LVALVEKYSKFELVMIPSLTNTLGVSLICELDDEKGDYSIGYNTDADFVLSGLGDGDLDMPAINQQEGTLTSVNKRVNPTNAAIGYGGYELNDIANALGFEAENVIDYTVKLPVASGFKVKEFDTLPNHYENDGTEVRGYVLENVAVAPTGDESVEKFSEDKLEGCIIYLANPVRQFTDFTYKTTNLDEVSGIYMSEEYLSKTDYNEGDTVTITTAKGSLTAKIVSDNKIAGDIIVLPTFDKKLNSEALFDGYRFSTASIQKG